MKLSVIIPCYNAADTISDQLDSLANQHWDQPWEVVVIDNDSTDHTVDIVKKYQNKIPHLRIIHANEKRNVAYARNTGVNNCEGDFLAFCDADDVVGANWVAGMGNALAKHPFVACKMDWATLNNFSKHTLNSKPQIDGVNSFFVDDFFSHAGGGSLGIRKDVHFEVNGFDESLPYLEDTDYCFRVQLEGYDLTFIPDALVHVRARSNIYKIFKQEMRWAEYGYYLYKRYQSYGAANYNVKDSVRQLYHNILSYRKLLDPERRCNWVIRSAIELGKIKGFLQYRLKGKMYIGRNKIGQKNIAKSASELKI